MRHIKSLVLPALIIVSACILIVAASWNESLTYDEVTYIPSGYSYLTRADMRINPEHPPLFKDMAGLPLLFMDIRQDSFSTPSWNDRTNDQWEFGRLFLFKTGNNAIAIAHAARLPMLFFFIVASGILFAWTRRRFGSTAAYMALIIFCFSPTVMAHAGFVVNDIAAACGALVALSTFVYFLRQPSYTRALGAGLGLGFALLTKFSNVLLIPLFFGLALFYAALSWRTKKLPHHTFAPTLLNSFIKVGVIYAIALFICVYPFYALHVWHYPPEKQRIDTQAIIGKLPLSDALAPLSENLVVRPLMQFTLGIIMNADRTSTGNMSYLAGEITKNASPFYFPFAYLIKEPLPWIVLVLTTTAFGITQFFKRLARGRKPGEQSFFLKYQDEFLMAVWIFSYGSLSLASNLTIGIRHLLPLYPFIIMLVCGLIMAAIRIADHHHASSGRLIRTGAWLLIAWYVVESLIAFPFYLPYFNQLVGGSKNGGAYLSDSNIDWGQELVRLRTWLDENGVAKIESDIFTSADVSYYLGDHFIPLQYDKYASAQDFMEKSATEWIAVSESSLREKWTAGYYDWLRAYEPVVIIGHAVRVYRITEKQ